MFFGQEKTLFMLTVFFSDRFFHSFPN